ncbi:MAG: TonB-dependent receptor, partial [Chlorobiaceae bacterium]|nr:TonB-dependent receptor [Chlorobiaceae bacterium]
MKAKQAHLYRAVRLLLSAFCLVALLVPVPSYGADTGTVRGKITDKSDGEGIYGASVVVSGTTIGTATDMNGNFTLQNVPAKQQKISISLVGYTPASQVVNVSTGQTSTLNLSLGQTTIMASEVVVGAALYKQDRLQVPVTVNVVSKEKIHQQPNESLDKAIEDVPGVVVTRAGGTTASTMQIRGSNAYQGGGIGTRVQAFYDGFPINSPETGEIVTQNINMNAADKIEVLKGAAATLYGSGAMGGVVNVYGHLPETFEVKAGASGGFYDAPPISDNSVYRKGYTPWFWNTYVGLGNKSGKLSYSILYTHSDDDGYKQNSQNYMNDVKLKVRYDIDAKQYLQLTSYYDYTSGGYTQAYGYQFSPTGARMFDTAFDISLATLNNFDDTITRKNALVGLNYVNLLSDKLSLDTRVFYTYNDSRIEYNHGAGSYVGSPYFPGGTFFPGSADQGNKFPGSFNDTNANRFGAGIKLDWKINDHNRILFGIDGDITDFESTQAAPTPVKINVFGTVQEKNAAIFLQDELKLTDKLTSLLSVRYDWSGIDADQVSYNKLAFDPFIPPFGGITSTPTVADITNPSVDAISPRVALNYKATDDMSFRASWGMSFRAPTIFERFVTDAGFANGNPNPNIDKETMQSWEVGMFKQFSDKVSFDIAGFLNYYDNLIQARWVGYVGYLGGLAGSPKIYYEYDNIARARIWGIETNLNIRPSNEWTINLAYTYMNARDLSYVPSADPIAAILNDKNPDPSWLQYRPEHTASTNVTWKPTSKFSMNVNGRYVSKYKNISQYTDKTGYNYPGDFVVFDAGFKVHPIKEMTLSLLCRNLGNVMYDEAEWFRSPGRSYILGVD